MHREPTSDELSAMLVDARLRTNELVSGLTDQQLIGPRLAIVNPLLWEIGHAAWFQEHWVLRHFAGELPIRADGDSLYDSARVPHDSRWTLPLPSRAETLDYMKTVLDRVLDRVAHRPLTTEFAYFLQLVAYHEDMHGEAFAYTRQTLGYPAPRITVAANAPPAADGAPLPGDVAVPAGTVMLGSTPDDGFVFDNEKWAHAVELKPFRIARAPVSNAEFVRFVEDRGYERRDLWCDAGWTWRERMLAKQPVYWQRRDGRLYARRNRDVTPLDPHLPVLHVNWFEADAYCRWAGRRLPTEAEWEAAASCEPTREDSGAPGLAPRKRRYPWGNEPPTPERANLDFARAGPVAVNLLPDGDSAFGCRQMIGNVWEWTASDFEPFPDFSADPYKEYSEPWFGGTHKVLRGGAFTTRSRMIRNNYRNFCSPDRRDVWAGIRTCAVD